MHTRPILLCFAAALTALAALGCTMDPWLQRAFPIHYWEEIGHYAEKRDLDPHLLAAIIAVESSFRPDAVSARGARGLMQLMPNTAMWAALQLDMDVSLVDLFEPEVNIAIGSWYLDYLRTELPTPTAWLAAYNAGQGNVRRWLHNGTWDGQWHTADSIPYAETRRYIRRVLYTREFYQRLYANIW